MMNETKIKTLVDALTEKEAAAVLPLIEMIIEDVRDFKTKNGWHYVSEEGLPEPGKEYWIAVHGADGDYCSQHKFILRNVRQIPYFYPVNGAIRPVATCSVPQWHDSDPEIMNYLNEYGRVYAWMPLPALPEVR